MARYHFHLTQVKRSRGQSVIAQAAYRAGEKLYSTYYGESSDFTRKRGVVMAEICLPDHAPGNMLTGKRCGMRWNGQSPEEKHSWLTALILRS